MRKSMVMLFVLILMLGGFSEAVYAADCTKDNPIEQFGDWFGNIGKKDTIKRRNIAARRANKLAACKEKEAAMAVKALKNSIDKKI